MPASRTFLVEAYAPSTSAIGTLEQQAEAVADAEPEAAVRHIRSFLVPEDEICFHLFEASSADSLARAMQRADLRAQRIVEVQG
jgi:hypothetical protein